MGGRAGIRPAGRMSRVDVKFRPWRGNRRLVPVALGLVSLPLLLIEVILAVAGLVTPSGADLDSRVAAISAAAGGSPLSAGEIPTVLASAVVAAEDERFFSHHGLDSIGVARSVWDDLRLACLCEGGSTITQQLAKVVYYSGQSSLVRKLPGMAVALKLESRYSKPHLLAAYLSVVATGFGLVGARAATCAYFSHGLDTLSVAQAAEVAGMIQAPSTYDPRRNPTLAQARRSYVLGRMLDQGLLTPAQARAANQSPLLMGRTVGGRRPVGCAAGTGR
jgi:penicillin-binding protein 1A